VIQKKQKTIQHFYARTMFSCSNYARLIRVCLSSGYAGNAFIQGETRKVYPSLFLCIMWSFSPKKDINHKFLKYLLDLKT